MTSSCYKVVGRDRDRPVLGVCLGAQLLAKALGARVFPGHGPEIGFGLVHLTPEGNNDPVLGPDGPSVPVFHWHGDTFELPAGASLLRAASIATRHFALGTALMAFSSRWSPTPLPGRRGARICRQLLFPMQGKKFQESKRSVER